VGWKRGATRLVAGEIESWREARRLRGPRGSGFTQNFAEENKEAPTQKVIKAYQLPLG
jgi:hypothetical protein